MTDFRTQDMYSRLGLTSKAIQEEIEKTYLRKLFTLPPDKGNNPEAMLEFNMVSESYEILSDPKSRKGYDQNYEFIKQMEEILIAIEKEQPF